MISTVSCKMGKVLTLSRKSLHPIHTLIIQNMLHKVHDEKLQIGHRLKLKKSESNLCRKKAVIYAKECICHVHENLMLMNILAPRN